MTNRGRVILVMGFLAALYVWWTRRGTLTSVRTTETYRIGHTEYDAIIAGASDTYNVPEAWIRAVITTESNWNPRAFRDEPRINDASYGLMQLLVGTARGLGFVGQPEDLFDPATNIYLGTELLAQLRRAHGTDFRRVYSAYNSGNPDLWQTSTQVARNTDRAVYNLQRELQPPQA